jgi:hypothetical protein
MDAFNISNDLMKTTFSARLESTPVVRRLRQGTFVTKEDVYAQAALHARAARPSANTENCSGSPGSVYPFLSGVLDDDLLARTSLSAIPADEHSSRRSPLIVLSSRAERKVAQGLRDATPRDIYADISREAKEDASSSAAPASPSTDASASPRRRPKRDALTTDLLAALKADLASPSPSRAPISGVRNGGSPLSPLHQAGAKAVLDAAAVSRMQNLLLSFHEQYTTAFAGAIRQVTGVQRPVLWLHQLDPLVGMAIAEAIDGQISLLHVVRDTLFSIPGDTASELSGRLSKSQIDYTVAKYLRTRRPALVLEPLDAAVGIVPFGRIALALVVDLLVTGSFAHDDALLAAAKRATIDGGPGRIVINISDLIAAVSMTGGADVDPNEAVGTLETLIASNGRIVFTAPSDDDPTRDIDWQQFAYQTSVAKADRRRRHVRATMHDLNTLLDSLQNFSMASATVCDVLASAIGINAAPSHSAYQLTDRAYDTAAPGETAAASQVDNSGAATDGEDAGDNNECSIFYMSSTESTLLCQHCSAVNPTRMMVCRNPTCRRFIAEVRKCTTCQLPSPIAAEKCHQWMCKGTKKTSQAANDQEVAAWESVFKLRLDSARQESSNARGDGGGGKGGKGGGGKGDKSSRAPRK